MVMLLDHLKVRYEFNNFMSNALLLFVLLQSCFSCLNLSMRAGESNSADDL